MNKKVKALVRMLRETQGRLDCLRGVMPQRASKHYLNGYAQAYAEQNNHFEDMNHEQPF